mgnify:CR=1 FL=1
MVYQQKKAPYHLDVYLVNSSIYSLLTRMEIAKGLRPQGLCYFLLRCGIVSADITTFSVMRWRFVEADDS